MDEYLKSFLTDQEIDALVRFNSDPVTFGAVKRIVLGLLYQNGTLRKGLELDASRNGAFGLIASSMSVSDEEAGQDLRALWMGISQLELAFKKLGEFTQPEPKGRKKDNPAR